MSAEWACCERKLYWTRTKARVEKIEVGMSRHVSRANWPRQVAMILTLTRQRKENSGSMNVLRLFGVLSAGRQGPSNE